MTKTVIELTDKKISRSEKGDLKSISATIMDDEFKKDIIDNIIQPSYRSDINYANIWRSRWYKIWSWFRTIAKLIIIGSSVIAFLASSDVISTDNRSLYAFIAGSFCIVSTLLTEFSDYAKIRSKKCTNELNELLRSLDINHVMPDITDNSQHDSQSREDSDATSDVDQKEKLQMREISASHITTNDELLENIPKDPDHSVISDCEAEPDDSPENKQAGGKVAKVKKVK
jgi:hypothetical protein